MFRRKEFRQRRIPVGKGARPVQQAVTDIQPIRKPRLHTVRRRRKADHRLVDFRPGNRIEPKADTAGNQREQKDQQAGLPIRNTNQYRHQDRKYGGKYGPSQIGTQLFLRFSFFFH